MHHFHSYILQKTPLKLINWFLRYEQLKDAKNNMKQKTFSALFGSILKSIFPTSDWFCLITSHMCMYWNEICAEGIFVTFPWRLKYVKSRPKIARFSNERHFEIWFWKKKRTITFFWCKLPELHQKDPILHATTFSLKQGETRTSHGPIPHPLNKSLHGLTFKQHHANCFDLRSDLLNQQLRITFQWTLLQESEKGRSKIKI